jgi:hypothetical protein
MRPTRSPPAAQLHLPFSLRPLSLSVYEGQDVSLTVTYTPIPRPHGRVTENVVRGLECVDGGAGAAVIRLLRTKPRIIDDLGLTRVLLRFLFHHPFSPTFSSCVPAAGIGLVQGLARKHVRLTDAVPSTFKGHEYRVPGSCSQTPWRGGGGSGGRGGGV